VVETPRWLWWPILHGVILRRRPHQSARAYARIWTQQGSPLLIHSKALTKALDTQLQQRAPGPLRIALAMRYGQPSIRETMLELQRQGVRRLLLLPLYPQYSASSTGSVIDAVCATLQNLRWPPELRIINDYHLDTGYLDALATSVHRHWHEHGRGERLLLSFHGLPKSYVRAGDPYLSQCQATAHALRQRLQLAEQELLLSFQSRVGRTPWLTPYTDHTLATLPGQGVRRLDVLCPGFAVDCLETLEEIALRGRAEFLAAGGKELHYIPALNAHSNHVQTLTSLALRHLQGWPETDPDWQAKHNRQESPPSPIPTALDHARNRD
ncbi:ferrochelatase, partial [Pseudomonas sp.]|uniref:ferrochelatase n=1 Tax=Pseudomonas sp. TaxID=306 RepID=UPI003CC566D1